MPTDFSGKNTGAKKGSFGTILLRGLVLVLICWGLIYIALSSYQEKSALVYRQHLDETAVTVDGETVTMGDMAFYIMFEENKVEKEAEVYNPDNTRDFWNIRLGSAFLSAHAKQAVMGMAVHDRIFYNKALEAGLTLTGDEREALDDRITDFWEDLYPTQKDHLLASVESINHTIYELTLAEKYQLTLAKKKDVSYHSLDWNGSGFEEIEKKHRVKVNDRLWRRVRLGNITLYHGYGNVINGVEMKNNSNDK